MSTFSSGVGANRLPAFPESNERFGTLLPLQSSNQSTWELFAEPQHYDVCVTWVLHLCYRSRPLPGADVMEVSRHASDRSDIDAGLSSRPGLVLDGTFETIIVDEAPLRRDGWFRRSVAVIAEAWVALQRTRQIRQSMSALSRMDDRALQDIGVDRGEIEYAVRYGRKPG